MPLALTVKSVCGSRAAQSCDGCAAVWTTSSMSRACRANSALDAVGVADVELGERKPSTLVDQALRDVGVVEASGPKKRARMSFSMPMTSKPCSAKWRTDSEPIRPPEPVTMAMGMGVR